MHLNPKRKVWHAFFVRFDNFFGYELFYRKLIYYIVVNMTLVSAYVKANIIYLVFYFVHLF